MKIIRRLNITKEKILQAFKTGNATRLTFYPCKNWCHAEVYSKYFQISKIGRFVTSQNAPF